MVKVCIVKFRLIFFDMGPILCITSSLTAFLQPYWVPIQKVKTMRFVKNVSEEIRHILESKQIAQQSEDFLLLSDHGQDSFVHILSQS